MTDELEVCCGPKADLFADDILAAVEAAACNGACKNCVVSTLMSLAAVVAARIEDPGAREAVFAIAEDCFRVKVNEYILRAALKPTVEGCGHA